MVPLNRCALAQGQRLAAENELGLERDRGYGCGSDGEEAKRPEGRVAGLAVGGERTRSHLPPAESKVTTTPRPEPSTERAVTASIR